MFLDKTHNKGGVVVLELSIKELEVFIQGAALMKAMSMRRWSPECPPPNPAWPRLPGPGPRICPVAQEARGLRHQRRLCATVCCSGRRVLWGWAVAVYAF